VARRLLFGSNHLQGSPCAAGPPAAARCLEQAVWQLRVDRRVLIGPGSAARTSYLRLGGFDTHSNQLADHPNLMRAQGGSIGAFYEDLASIQTGDGNAQDRVMILAWSEFGRRVAENKGGTDHGTAGLSNRSTTWRRLPFSAPPGIGARPAVAATRERDTRDPEA
jgi:uncharacterized protein (DUF1501 family)